MQEACEFPMVLGTVMKPDDRRNPHCIAQKRRREKSF